MEKSICITPTDSDMELLAKAAWLLNEFRTLGYDSRSRFVEAVAEINPSFGVFPQSDQLVRFWNKRVQTAEMNTELERVLVQLKPIRK